MRNSRTKTHSSTPAATQKSGKVYSRRKLVCENSPHQIQKRNLNLTKKIQLAELRKRPCVLRRFLEWNSLDFPVRLRGTPPKRVERGCLSKRNRHGCPVSDDVLHSLHIPNSTIVHTAKAISFAPDNIKIETELRVKTGLLPRAVYPPNMGFKSVVPLTVFYTNQTLRCTTGRKVRWKKPGSSPLKQVINLETTG
jgi:hypothetical protein